MRRITSLLHLPALACLAVLSAQGGMIVSIDGWAGTPFTFGVPGGSAGWGGTITYEPDYPGQPTQWALFTGVDFDTIIPLGVFTPFFASSDFVVLAHSTPANTWSQTYNATIAGGIGQVDIFPDVAAGSSSLGNLIFYYDLYSADPFTSTDPDILIGSGYSILAPVIVEVQGSTIPDPVPEPASAALVGLGLVGVVTIGHRFRRKPR